MRALSVFVNVLLVNYFHLVLSLTVPPNRAEWQALDTQYDQLIPVEPQGSHLQLKGRAEPKPAKPTPRVQPSKPAGQAAPTKPADASKKPTLVKPLPFIKEPRPTAAYNICNLPVLDCGSDGEDYAEVLGKRDHDGTGIAEAHELRKRTSPRTYSTVVGGGTPTMMMTSLPYPPEAKLFPAGGPKVILDFSTDNVRDASLKMYASVPKRTKPSTYIVEHIVELQSIMLFIKAATRHPSQNGVPTLSEHIDISFFNKHWGTSNPQVQQKIATRPNPFPGYNPKVALSSLNDLVFEAMGSKSNPADFVLCEEGINSMKAKLWGYISPFAPRKWREIAKGAADGSIPSNHHLSGMRSILGVHNYMNHPDVTKRLQDTVKNVKIELSNFKHISGEDVKNVKGKVVDLPALWVEFMSAQLEEVFRSGTQWIKDQVDYATPMYKAHLADLQKAMKRITDEEALKDATKRQAATDKRVDESNKLIKQLPSDQTALTQAETRLEQAKRALNAANAALKNVPAASRAAALADRRVKFSAKESADRIYYQTLVTKGKRERDIIKLRKTELKALIEDVEADIKQMTDYRTAAVAMKVPKAA
ncbi:hypothetical protein OPT61_g5304 [Boeremia exigua]|uniref:Uncharacterized protein n=1 Tax=Boeremia exigua TaxID=749465 RepID=A0ACC2IAT2_9PLEO|nr:hypothetical protein OPT61_g5304 [Boeremia exigua]